MRLILLSPNLIGSLSLYVAQHMKTGGVRSQGWYSLALWKNYGTSFFMAKAIQSYNSVL